MRYDYTDFKDQRYRDEPLVLTAVDTIEYQGRVHPIIRTKLGGSC